MATPVAPGMGQAEIGNAVVLPEYNQQQFARGDYLNQLQAAQALQQQKAQQQAQVHRQALEKYANGLLTDKNLLTGTEYDPTISGILNDGTKAISAIAADPTADPYEIQQVASQYALKAHTLSEKIKFLNSGVTGATGGLEGSKGVNLTALQRAAMLNLTHEDDGKGGFTLKDPDHIDVSQPSIDGAINKVIDKNPDLVAGGADAIDWRPAFEKAKPITETGSYSTGVNGRDIKKNYAITLQPWQQVERDASGQIVVDPTTGQPKVSVMSQMAPAVKDGVPSNTPILANEPYNVIESSINGRLFIAKQFEQVNKDRAASGLQPIEPDSMAGDILKKKIAYDTLNARNNDGSLQVPPSNSKIDYADSNDKQWVQGEIDARQRRSIAAANARAKAPKETYAGAMVQVLKGNPNYLTGTSGDSNSAASPTTGEPITIVSPTGDGNMVDISTAVPSGKILSNNLKTALNPDPSNPSQMIETKTNIPYLHVWFDKNAHKIYTQDDENSPLVDAGDPKQFILKTSAANGTTTEQASQIVKQLEGNSKQPQPSAKSYKFNGKTFSEPQIQNAAKQAGMSVDDYTKKYGIQ